MATSPELILGTAQLGMPYGVTGPQKGVAQSDALNILSYAYTQGVSCFDTAAGYGDSERRIGNVLGDIEDVRIITKLHVLEPGSSSTPEQQVQDSIRCSLKRLRRQHLDILMVHRAGDLLGSDGASLWRALETLKEEQLIGRLGVSIYRGDEIDNLLERYPLDLVQLPLNLFDQRLLASGHVDRLHKHGVEIHMRSVFLQGLLLLESRVPDHFRSLEPKLHSLRSDLERHGLKPIDAALGFTRTLPQVGAIIIGVDNIKQLDEILARWRHDDVPKLDYKKFAVEEESLLNPCTWPPREELIGTMYQ